jgi:hypothetical protein
MTVERMMDWTHLSRVQEQEEKLFADAFSAIDKALLSPQ